MVLRQQHRRETSQYRLQSQAGRSSLSWHEIVIIKIPHRAAVNPLKL